MSIFDIFKKKPTPRKKTEEKRAEPKKAVKPPTKKQAVPKEEKKTVAKEIKEPKKPEIIVEAKKAAKPRKASRSNMAWKVLDKPHITEKATELTKSNQYAFKVFNKTNKVEVKQAIQEVYGVDVEKVRIINVAPKKRRVGRTEGWRKGYKKAIVTIKKGQEIEVLPR